jgi:3-hydroxyacyl-[acyl-carrier-protein] dehydratase
VIAIDDVLELEPGVRIVARSSISASNEVFRDHFPGFPVLPGALLLDLFDQAGAKLLGPQGAPSLRRVERLTFSRAALPGDRVILTLEHMGNRSDTELLSAKAEADGQLLARATLLFDRAASRRNAP